MATLTGPMLSLEARGALAKTLTFRHIRGRATVGRFLVPPNPKTPAQISIRGMNRRLAQAWQSISTANKATWQTDAEQKRIAPYHAYLSLNMKRWNRQRGLSQVAGAPELLGVSFLNPFSVFTTTPGKILFLATLVGSNLWNLVFFSIPTGETPFGRNNFLDFTPVFASPFWGGTYYNHPPGTFDFYGWAYGLDGTKSNVQGPFTKVVP
ncbi:hypothetical protein LCGC14_1389700 [marine sediment metagenome]|uniref:Uncharacterized protein n=1 Tax=marine sediment metagenome TaxID=412755 RepID=A0A0F9MFW7_9ZZZZ